MRRWAEFVLAHRRWVVLFWLVVIVGGGVASGPVSERLTYDWSLPGEPGAETAKQITQTFGNGGYTAPYLVSVTYPAGQSVAGHQAEVAAAFDAVATKVPSVRVLDEANTGDAAFRTTDGRSAYALVFYRFNPSPTVQLPTQQLRAALEAAKPAGSTVGVTGQDALAVGSDTDGPGVLAETLLGGVGALAVLAFVFASMLALLPLVVAAASILATFAMLLPLTYLGDFSALVQFLIALVGLGVAIDCSLLLVTRWREERGLRHLPAAADADRPAHLRAGAVAGVAVRLVELVPARRPGEAPAGAAVSGGHGAGVGRTDRARACAQSLAPLRPVGRRGSLRRLRLGVALLHRLVARLGRLRRARLGRGRRRWWRGRGLVRPGGAEAQVEQDGQPDRQQQHRPHPAQAVGHVGPADEEQQAEPGDGEAEDQGDRVQLVTSHHRTSSSSST